MKQEEGEEGNEQEERCVELFWLKPHLAEFVGSSRSTAAMEATALPTAADMKKSECSPQAAETELATQTETAAQLQPAQPHYVWIVERWDHDFWNRIAVNGFKNEHDAVEFTKEFKSFADKLEPSEYRVVRIEYRVVRTLGPSE